MVLLMAPPKDCFAIATPYAGESHYSTYLSLFGRNIKAGRTARTHTRLIVTKPIPDTQIPDLYQKYIKDLAQGNRIKYIQQTSFDPRDYDDDHDLIGSLRAYFDYYNNRTPHASLGYRTPAEVYEGSRRSLRKPTGPNKALQLTP